MIVDILAELVDPLTHLQFHHLEHQFFGGGGEVFPHHAVLFAHQAVDRLGDHGGGGIEEVGFHLVHIDGIHHGGEPADAADGRIDHAGGELADTRGHHPPPAEGELADVLQRVEGHLDGEPVSAPARTGGNEGDQQVAAVGRQPLVHGAAPRARLAIFTLFFICEILLTN